MTARLIVGVVLLVAGLAILLVGQAWLAAAGTALMLAAVPVRVRRGGVR